MFPASTVRLADGLDRTSETALLVRRRVQSLRDDSAAGEVRRDRLVGILRELSQAITTWNAVAALPGIAAYARDQYGDSGLDVAAEFNAMVAAATDLRDWIFANFPKDLVSGAWLAHAFDENGQQTHLTFTTAQMAGFRSRADVFIATVG